MNRVTKILLAPLLAALSSLGAGCGGSKGTLEVHILVPPDDDDTAAQRFYNNLCIAYGGDPNTFNDFVQKKLLPRGRALGCQQEYQKITASFRKLILPYVDVAVIHFLLRPSVRSASASSADILFFSWLSARQTPMTTEPSATSSGRCSSRFTASL